jgi:hypothetical protein
MKRWLIAAVVAILLSTGLVFWLAFLAASMIRLKAELQDSGARPTGTEQAGMAFAELWFGYMPLVGAAAAAVCFALTFAIAAAVGRRRPGA